jgi:ABC-type Fe3+/spermidine/putrescine transport system ATPase subunit
MCPKKICFELKRRRSDNDKQFVNMMYNMMYLHERQKSIVTRVSGGQPKNKIMQ